MVSIDAFQALDPGSIPGHRILFYMKSHFLCELLGKIYLRNKKYKKVKWPNVGEIAQDPSAF